MSANSKQIAELLYQALETELGGVKVYEAAIALALNPDLKREWTKYLEETRRHQAVLEKVLRALELDPDEETPGRSVVRHIGQSLVEAMELAGSGGGSPQGAEIVAAECVVLAETKDHANWELLGKVADALGDKGALLEDAYDEIEDQEDEHLYHTRGWARELWIASLGMPAVLPPPEEVKKVTTATGAAKAEANREQMLNG